MWMPKLHFESILRIFGVTYITNYHVKYNLLSMRELFVEVRTKLVWKLVEPDDLHSTVSEDNNEVIGLAICLWIILSIKYIINNYHFSKDQIGIKMGKLLESRKLSQSIKKQIFLSKVLPKGVVERFRMLQMGW